MRPAARRLAFLLLPVIHPAVAAAQSTVYRTPDLDGGWVGEPGTIYLDGAHHAGDDRVNGVTSLFVAYGVAPLVLAGVRYAASPLGSSDTRSDDVELVARLAPLQPGSGLPAEFALSAGYGVDAGSVDGELALGGAYRGLTLMTALRGFTDAFDEGDGRWAAGAGLRLALHERVSLAGDAVTMLGRREGEKVAWGVGLQWSVTDALSASLHAGNATSPGLQGSSRGAGGTRLGLRATVPIDLARGGGADRTRTADTVRVEVSEAGFTPATLEVSAGTTVLWTHRGSQPHSVTDVSGAWTSPLMAPGESYGRVFAEPGTFTYRCRLHGEDERATIRVVPRS